jgi:asparagine synthase (glutamine-hydrolysing)
VCRCGLHRGAFGEGPQAPTIVEIPTEIHHEVLDHGIAGEGLDELFGGYHRYLLLYHDEQIRQSEAMGEYGYLIDKYYGAARTGTRA